MLGWTLILPPPRIAGIQFMLIVDLTLATAALFMLLPVLPLAVFLTVHVGSLVAFFSGLLAHAPGGLDVFEAVMLLAQSRVDCSALFAALLLFRITDYLVPLALGVALLPAYEQRVRHGRDRCRT